MNGIDGYYSSPDFVCTILLLDRKICFFEITDIYICKFSIDHRSDFVHLFFFNRSTQFYRRNINRHFSYRGNHFYFSLIYDSSSNSFFPSINESANSYRWETNI